MKISPGGKELSGAKQMRMLVKLLSSQAPDQPIVDTGLDKQNF